MKLKLEQVPKRSLEIEKPDGTTVVLTLKRFPLKDIPALEQLSKELDKDRIRGKIDTRDFYNQLISLVVDDFKPGCFDDLEVEHITAISENLQELRQNKEKDEKKSPEI